MFVTRSLALFMVLLSTGCGGLVAFKVDSEPQGAKIYLDNERISRRHAIIFRFNDAPAVFDIGGEAGIRVNGSHCSLAPLRDEDRIRVGSFRLVIGLSASF